VNASVLPAWRVAWLLTRLRLRRMLNLAGALGAGKNKRKGTRRKKPTSLLLTAAVVLAMAASFGNLARDAVVHLGRLVAHRPLGVGQAFSPALAHVLSVERFTDRTRAVLADAAGQPRRMLALALASPEYAVH